MPVGTRPLNPEERRWLRELSGIPMVVGTSDWRDRFALAHGMERGDKITIAQARKIRSLVARYMKKLPKGAAHFSKSGVGTFPYTQTPLADRRDAMYGTDEALEFRGSPYED
jgi:hypothetical protein